jgi:hypothetical protein
MPLPNAQGPITHAEQTAAMTLAHCTAFQQLLGVDTAAAALARIHFHECPKPAGEAYTLAEITAMRPFALIYTVFPYGYAYRKVASFAWDDAGTIAIEIEWSIPLEIAGDEAAISRTFLNSLGRIIRAQENESDADRGLLDLFDTETTDGSCHLSGTEVRVVDVLRSSAEHVATDGDAIKAILLIEWGNRR